MKHSQHSADRAFLMTGATGFIGRRLLARLLRRGEIVFVVIRARRSLRQGPAGAACRLARLLADIGCADRAAQAILVEGDVGSIDPVRLAARLGAEMSGMALRRLTVVNIAASLRMDFSGQDPDQAEQIRALNQRTNVGGIRRLLEALDLAERQWPGRVQVEALVHFSTAYAHGARRGELREVPLDDACLPRNAYESTKRQSEALLQEWHAARKARTRLTILRPGIVVGPDTRDGLCAWLDLMAAPVSIDTLRPWLRRLLGLQRPAYSTVDLALDAARRLRLPIPLLGNGKGILDLIDVEDVVRYSEIAIDDRRGPDRVPQVLFLHLTHPAAQSLRAACGTILAAFGRAGDARRICIIGGFVPFAWLLMLLSLLPVVGRQVKSLYERTQMLRPYLLRPSGTYFSTSDTRAYFSALGQPYEPAAIDIAYLRQLIRLRAATSRAQPVRADRPATASAELPRHECSR